MAKTYMAMAKTYMAMAKTYNSTSNVAIMQPL